MIKTKVMLEMHLCWRSLECIVHFNIFVYLEFVVFALRKMYFWTFGHSMKSFNKFAFRHFDIRIWALGIVFQKLVHSKSVLRYSYVIVKWLFFLQIYILVLLRCSSVHKSNVKILWLRLGPLIRKQKPTVTSIWTFIFHFSKKSNQFGEKCRAR